MEYVVGAMVVVVLWLLFRERRTRAELLWWAERYGKVERAVQALSYAHSDDEAHAVLIRTGQSDRMSASPAVVAAMRPAVDELS